MAQSKVKDRAKTGGTTLNVVVCDTQLCRRRGVGVQEGVRPPPAPPPPVVAA